MEIHTSICRLDEEKHTIEIRGHDFIELSQSFNFEKLAYFLINEELPSEEELIDFSKRGFATRKGVAQAINSQPELVVKPMEMLQSLSASLNYYYDEWDYINQLLMSTAVFFQANLEALPNYESQVLGLLSPNNYDNYETKLEAVTVLLNLYSEHELNASTLVARVVASTGASLQTSVSAAIGALSGPLHGGANEKIIPFLSTLNLSDYQDIIDEHFEDNKKIMGFGHAIYKDGDPRSPIAFNIAKSLVKGANDQRLLDIAERVAQYIFEKKGLHPNLDYYAALSLHFLQASPSLFTPFFVYSRVVGWVSHIIEQKRQKKLIRPRAVYQ